MINKRRMILKEKTPAEAGEILRLAGWTYDGPSKGKEISPDWINPRTKRRHTKQSAINIEELNEQLR